MDPMRKEPITNNGFAEAAIGKTPYEKATILAGVFRGALDELGLDGLCSISFPTEIAAGGTVETWNVSEYDTLGKMFAKLGYTMIASSWDQTPTPELLEIALAAERAGVPL